MKYVISYCSVVKKEREPLDQRVSEMANGISEIRICKNYESTD